MGVLTNLLKLLKPGENDYYNQQTEQADNWDKVDNYAVYTDRDKNAAWGGLDGRGLIEDPAVVKEVGKRYIGADGKAYICLKPSNINNLDNYMPCNVVDNLERTAKLNGATFTIRYNNNSLFADLNGGVKKVGRVIEIEIKGNMQPKTINNVQKLENIIPIGFRPVSNKRFVLLGANGSQIQSELDINSDGSIQILYSSEVTTTSKYVQFCGMYFSE